MAGCGRMSNSVNEVFNEVLKLISVLSGNWKLRVEQNVPFIYNKIILLYQNLKNETVYNSGKKNYEI